MARRGRESAPVNQFRRAAAVFLSLFCLPAIAQEKVIRIYDGPAPGSEDWKQTEQESRTNLWQTRVVFNVANPTLTVFQPEAGKANGTAVLFQGWTRFRHAPTALAVGPLDRTLCGLAGCAGFVKEVREFVNACQSASSDTPRRN